MAAICLLDREKDVVRLFALESPGLVNHLFDVGAEVELKESHVGWVLENRKPLLRADEVTGKSLRVARYRGHGKMDAFEISRAA